jgi:hypothetical protein
MKRLEITLTNQQIAAFNENRTVTLKVPKLYEKVYLGGGRIFDIQVDPRTYEGATYLTYGRASKVGNASTGGTFYLPEKVDSFTIRKAHPSLPDTNRLKLQLLIAPVGEKVDSRVSFTPPTPVIKTGLVSVGGRRYKISGNLVIRRSDFSKILTFQELVPVTSLGNVVLTDVTITLGNDTVRDDSDSPVGAPYPSGEVFLFPSEFTTTKTSVILPVTIEFEYPVREGGPVIDNYYQDVNLYFIFGQKGDI